MTEVPPTLPQVAPLPIAPTRRQLLAERRIARDAEVWLANRQVPEEAILWWPGWRRTQPIEAKSATHLATLIGGLPKDRFGGVTLGPITRGPWAQAWSNGDGTCEIELHPDTHEGGEGGMYFEKVGPVSAVSAGALGWAWVKRKPLPVGVHLDPRVVPPGSMWDVPL